MKVSARNSVLYFCKTTDTRETIHTVHSPRTDSFPSANSFTDQQDRLLCCSAADAAQSSSANVLKRELHILNHFGTSEALAVRAAAAEENRCHAVRTVRLIRSSSAFQLPILIENWI